MLCQFGGVDMSILDNKMFKSFKDSLSTVKVTVAKILTPVTYMEYCFKFILVLDNKRIKVVFKISSILIVFLVILRIIFPSYVRLSSLVLCLCYNIILFTIIIKWKERKKKKNNDKSYKHNENKIKVRHQDLKVSELPSQLKKILKQEE